MKNLLNLLFLSICLFFSNPLKAQTDSIQLFGKKIVDTLTTPYFFGRGYLKDGMKKGSEYIVYRFKEIGLKPIGNNNYQQFFTMPVNRLHSLGISINGKKEIKIGNDIIPSAGLPSINATYKVLPVNQKIFSQKNKLKKTLKKVDENTLIFLDARAIKDSLHLKEVRKVRQNQWQRAAGFIEVKDKLTWTVSRSQDTFLRFFVLPDVISSTAKSVSIKAETELLSDFRASNVIGMIEGKTKPDSFVFFTAHYDHLGGIGERVYFPGANDNASGTAMLLTLANHYSKPENQPDYTMVFAAFAAEEAGLIGSKFYTENPNLDLNKIKFLINMDMVGTGVDGITVVNVTEFPEHFNLLKNLNTEKKYLKEIKKRGTARNSDHYYFYEKGVPAIFIYTLGGKYYHDVFDTGESIPYTAFSNLFYLLTDFVKEIK